ncbi:YTH domain protein [Niveomyces insectorum RCEF 264]|uniref:YTH domain protein n=1 Tax=Niveomyces insectorum RCEF 264 TaxID=1081102 RepID=A0A167M0I7_9HYPO|nr:YTH domain protein [Niveomyces insectorum RCEF 264]
MGNEALPPQSSVDDVRSQQGAPSALSETRRQQQKGQQQEPATVVSSQSGYHHHPQQQQPALQQPSLLPQQQLQHHQQQSEYYRQPQQHDAASIRPPFQPLEAMAGRHGPYDTSAMAQALPKIDYGAPLPYGPGVQRFTPAATPSPGVYPRPGPHYVGPIPSPTPAQPFYIPQPPPPIPAPQFHGRTVPVMHAAGPANVFPPRPGYGYYANAMSPPSPYYYGQPSSPYFPQNQGMQIQGDAGRFSPSSNYAQRGRQPQPLVVSGSGQSDSPASSQRSSQRPQQEHSDAPGSSVVRGPPRKPKQSGHAIWIGNLPPQTDLMSLVHHVCQLTTGLESLFLISKSNCAFANFPDEESCLSAQQKLNDSWFMSVRLVSRLRKNAAEGTQSASTADSPQPQQAPSSSEETQEDGAALVDGPPPAGAADQATSKREVAIPPQKAAAATALIVDGTGKSRQKNVNELDATAASGGFAGELGNTAHHDKDRFFILKSLTVEDLELSVRTGIWATQSHNEEKLNNAFKSCENVYLVFSANKSGEYFGYARMTSQINDDPAAAIKFAPATQTFDDVELPKAIPTEAAGSTPRGRIIDDSARGTIFWEAQRDETSEDAAVDGVETDPPASVDAAAAAADDVSSLRSGDPDPDPDAAGGVDEPRAWGKPFQLEWLSTARLPFYRTRGMRNPLNANREIKIARDGTEVDPAVGRQLIRLFHEAATTSPAAVGGRPSIGSATGGYTQGPY